MKTRIALISAASVALLAGCGSTGSGFTYTRGPAPAQKPAEPSPCGTVNGRPVQCVPRFPDFGGSSSSSGGSAGGSGIATARGAGTATSSAVAEQQKDFSSWAQYPLHALAEDRRGPLEYQFATMATTSIDGDHTVPASTVWPTWSAGFLFDSQRNFSSIPAAYLTAPDVFDKARAPMLSLAAAGGEGITLTYLPYTSGERQSRFLAPAPAGESAIVANPHALGWNYQAFGVWDSYATSMISARSFGAATLSSAPVPASGQAAFTGKLGGFHISAAGEGSVAVSQLVVQADFGARTLDFASSGTMLTRDAKAAMAAPHLDLAGRLTYAAGSNRFAGDLKNADGTLNGATHGRFYGPHAQELGGFAVVKSATTRESFAAAYGAKR